MTTAWSVSHERRAPSFHVNRWLLCYLTRYKGSTWRQISGSTTYSRELVLDWLNALIRTGYVVRKGDRFYAVEGWGWYIAR